MHLIHMLASQSKINELMSDENTRYTAGKAVADAALTMLKTMSGSNVLVVAGANYRGRISLLAAAELLAGDVTVEVIIGDSVEPSWMEEFEEVGGRLHRGELEKTWDLVIDAAVGGDAEEGLDKETYRIFQELHSIPVLSVDFPSGVAPESGTALRNQVRAMVTIALIQPRMVHLASVSCGQVVVSDLWDSEHRKLSDMMFERSYRIAVLAVPAKTPFPWVAGEMDGFSRAIPLDGWGSDMTVGSMAGGVLHIAVGDDVQQSRAGYFVALGAVRALAATVDVIGAAGSRVADKLPEVFWDENSEADICMALTSDVGQIGRFLAGERPVIIDGAAVVAVAENANLINAVAENQQVLLMVSAQQLTLLAKAKKIACPDPAAEPVAAAETLAQGLRCGVVLKGSALVFVSVEEGLGCLTKVVGTGSTLALTPGADELLAGMVGAWAAWTKNSLQGFVTLNALISYDLIWVAGLIWARAAVLAAQTPSGQARVSASMIADAIPEASAAANSGSQPQWWHNKKP